MPDTTFSTYSADDLREARRSKAEYDAAHDALMDYAARVYFMLPEEGREPDSSCEGFLQGVRDLLTDQFTRECWDMWREVA